MHSDPTNAHSRLQRSVGGLVVPSCDDHELRLITVDLKLVGEQPDPDLPDDKVIIILLSILIQRFIAVFSC